ncbi:MAG: hypothetical protein KJ747_06330 [Actinobacteria bacterium]|nr:hypothetical protein [Actinomycetota bacterium]MCG2807917.1 hypothetical protein [Coriobacteriia bacterium]
MNSLLKYSITAMILLLGVIVLSACGDCVSSAHPHASFGGTHRFAQPARVLRDIFGGMLASAQTMVLALLVFAPRPDRAASGIGSGPATLLRFASLRI